MLERIQKANDIKKLAPEELPELAQEIRQFLIEKISRPVVILHQILAW